MTGGGVRLDAPGALGLSNDTSPKPHLAWPTVLGLFLALTPRLTWSAKAPPIECHDAASGSTKKVTPRQVQAAIKAVQRSLTKRKLHILDLSDEARDRRSRLAQDVEDQQWCVVSSHATAIADAIAAVHIDDQFAASKFARVERWARGLTDAARHGEVDKLLAVATAQLAEHQADKANQTLNRVIALLFDSKDPWQIPANLPTDAEANEAEEAVTVDDSEVAGGCPEVGKRDSATRDELKQTLARLSSTMQSRGLRMLDVKSGEQLSAELTHYVGIGATWPATRIACALIRRFTNAEIGLSLVMKRFGRVNSLRNTHGLPAHHDEFNNLVRQATDQIAARQFTEANATLEQLLVQMGEPASPASVLPVLE